MNESMFYNIINPEWHKIFDKIDKKIFKKTEEEYNKIKNDINIFPKFNDIFSFTNYCSFDDVNVVIIGQDTYHQQYYDPITKQNEPQATGLAFSVPKNCPIPPSLKNIYENLIKYKHIDKKPTEGNLQKWSSQGVLLLNTSLTVEKGKPNSHQYIWSDFTNEFIKVITEMKNDLIIVLWGGFALKKKKIMKNQDVHKFIISSHPSPLGYKNKIETYNSFYETDCFGKINDYLIDNNKKKIKW